MSEKKCSSRRGSLMFARWFSGARVYVRLDGEHKTIDIDVVDGSAEVSLTSETWWRDLVRGGDVRHVR
jgi:hypothetical protein